MKRQSGFKDIVNSTGGNAAVSETAVNAGNRLGGVFCNVNMLPLSFSGDTKKYISVNKRP